MQTINYIKSRISASTEYSWINDIDWDSSIVKNPIEFLMQFSLFASEVEDGKLIFEDETIKRNVEFEDADGNSYKQLITVKYSQDVYRPDFLGMNYSQHDGTFLFTRNVLFKIFERILSGSHPIARGYSQKELLEKDMEYVVGDLLWHHAPVDHVDEANGKMFPGTKDSMAMAVQLDLT